MLCAIAAPSITVAVMCRLAGELNESFRASVRQGARSPGRVGFLLDQLEEDLVPADHAQLAARAFFDGVEPDLEIAYFGVQRLVARGELAIHLALLADLSFDFPH